ncbi:hypothetical protein C8R44DRAFT_746586 [Mycena epipterygia]|nr:hypothetical protein C8R44DRAFT_746586 [Mycena epipterygia]
MNDVEHRCTTSAAVSVGRGIPPGAPKSGIGCGQCGVDHVYELRFVHNQFLHHGDTLVAEILEACGNQFDLGDTSARNGNLSIFTAEAFAWLHAIAQTRCGCSLRILGCMRLIDAVEVGEEIVIIVGNRGIPISPAASKVKPLGSTSGRIIGYPGLSSSMHNRRKIFELGPIPSLNILTWKYVTGTRAQKYNDARLIRSRGGLRPSIMWVFKSAGGARRPVHLGEKKVRGPIVGSPTVILYWCNSDIPAIWVKKDC